MQIGNFGSLVFEGEETNYAFVTNNIDQLEQIAETGLQYSVDEALCFGWIDGLRKSIDSESYKIRFRGKGP